MLKPLDWYKSLADGEGRIESNAFLVEGRRAISQVCSCSPGSILEVLYEKNADLTPVCQAPVRILTSSQFKSVVQSKTPQGIAAVVALPSATYTGELPAVTGQRILLLDDIQDPGNAGTLIRTASALGYNGILMTSKCADPFSGKCVQASAGTVLSVWIRRSLLCAEITEKLISKGYMLAAADMNGTPVEEASVGKRCILALGNEGSGLSEQFLKMSSLIISIPIIKRRAESLNVAAAGAICMYVLASKMK